MWVRQKYSRSLMWFFDRNLNFDDYFMVNMHLLNLKLGMLCFASLGCCSLWFWSVCCSSSFRRKLVTHEKITMVGYASYYVMCAIGREICFIRLLRHRARHWLINEFWSGLESYFTSQSHQLFLYCNRNCLPNRYEDICHWKTHRANVLIFRCVFLSNECILAYQGWIMAKCFRENYFHFLLYPMNLISVERVRKTRCWTYLNEKTTYKWQITT